MPLRALALVVFLVASIPVCFFRPFYGIVLWVIIAFLNPQSFTWTAFDAFPWALSVAIPTMLGMVLFDRKLERLLSREVALLLILWTWFTITTVVSINTPVFVHHATDTLERWRFVSKILLMTVCMIPIVSSFERLRYFVLTIAACFGFYVLKAIPFIVVTKGAFRIIGPARSMIGDNTDFGMALDMTLPMFFFLAHAETKRWLKRLLWLLFVATIPVIFFTYSRGALVGLAAVFVVMLLQFRRWLALVPVAVLAVVIALAFAPEKWQERMDLTRPETVDGSAQSRLNAWAYARALAADYPITGGGFATFTEELYTQYWPGRVVNIYGPHSVYFQVLAEHGYIGLGLYLLLVASCFLTTRRLHKAARRHGDNQVIQYALMFQLSLVGFLISGLFLGRAYFDYFFTIVACITILDRCAKDRWMAVTKPAAVPATISTTVGLPLSREFSLHGRLLLAPDRK